MEELIDNAERELELVFPDALKDVWRTHNVNELAGGWRFYPVFDPGNPRKTAGSIAYESLRGAWGQHLRSLGLLAVADNGTGNHLVMRVVEGKVEPVIRHWHHETGKVTAWKPGMESVLRSARKSAEAMVKIRARLAGGVGRG